MTFTYINTLETGKVYLFKQKTYPIATWAPALVLEANVMTDNYHKGHMIEWLNKALTAKQFVRETSKFCRPITEAWLNAEIKKATINFDEAQLKLNQLTTLKQVL